MVEHCWTEHVDIDGQPRTVVIRGSQPMGDASRAALAAVVSAAENDLAERDTHWALRQELNRAVRAATACIPDGPVNTILHIRDGATVKDDLRNAMRAVLDALSPADPARTAEPDTPGR